MTRPEQRIADLECQVTDLAAEVAKLRAEAFAVRTLEETRVRLAGGWRPAAPPPRRPRHLHAVSGGAR